MRSALVAAVLLAVVHFGSAGMTNVPTPQVQVQTVRNPD